MMLSICINLRWSALEHNLATPAPAVQSAARSSRAGPLEIDEPIVRPWCLCRNERPWSVSVRPKRDWPLRTVTNILIKNRTQFWLNQSNKFSISNWPTCVSVPFVRNTVRLIRIRPKTEIKRIHEKDPVDGMFVRLFRMQFGPFPIAQIEKITLHFLHNLIVKCIIFISIKLNFDLIERDKTVMHLLFVSFDERPANWSSRVRLDRKRVWRRFADVRTSLSAPFSKSVARRKIDL